LLVFPGIETTPREGTQFVSREGNEEKRKTVFSSKDEKRKREKSWNPPSSKKHSRREKTTFRGRKKLENQGEAIITNTGRKTGCVLRKES